MMKRLLFSALSVLFAFSASAVDTDDYVYTPGGRYLLGEEQTSIDLSLPAAWEEPNGWTSIGADALASNFKVENGYLSAVNVAYNYGLYKKFTVSDNTKTYVLVFDAKSPESNFAHSFTPRFMGNQKAQLSHLSVYATGGEYLCTALEETYAFTDGDKVAHADKTSKRADMGLGFQLSSEYQTYATALTNDGSDLTWFIEISGLQDGVSLGNIHVYEATQVYDNRFLQNKIDYLNAIINVYDWESMDKTPAQTNLWNFIKAAPEDLNGMADMTSVEDGTTMVNAVNDSITNFFGAFFGDFAAENKIRFQDSNDAPSNKATSVAGWAPTNRWSHSKLNSEIFWGNYAWGNANSETITQTKELKAGTYVFAIDSYLDAIGSRPAMNNASSKGKDYVATRAGGWYNDCNRSAICRGKMTLSILDEQGEKFVGSTIDLDNQVDQTAVVAFAIPEGEDGEYTFKITAVDTYAENNYGKAGGRGHLNNLRIFFKPAGKYDAAQLAYIEKVREQITTLRTNYDKSESYYTDPEGKYYWYKWAVQDTSAIYLPYLEFYETLTDDQIIEGYEDPASKDAKEAAAAAGMDVSDWDCETSYAKYINMVPYIYYEENPETGEMEPKEGTRRQVNAIDTIMNRAVRPILRLNERFTSFNQHIFDCQDVIARANQALNTRVFQELQGYEVLKGATEGAEETLEGFLEDPEDYDALVEYSEGVDETANTLSQNVTDFYDSGYNPGSEPTPIKNFDFDNGTFALDDPETDPGAGTYTGAGTDNGVMTIGSLELGTATGSTAVTYCNGFLSDGAWTNTGVLRVGASDATVALDEEEMVSGTDALHVAFDFYIGNLSGKSAGVYLNDAEGTHVAGIWGSKYDGNWLTNAYNPFKIDGNKDFSGVGSSSASNLAIVDESNRTHLDFYLDYGDKTMFVIVNNAKMGVVNKRYDAAMDNQNPIAAIVVNSNYNNKDRRCWFDNLVIEKIALGGTVTIKGDANNDGRVSIADVTTIAAYLLGDTPESFSEENADANGDGRISIADVTTVATMLLDEE